MPTARQREASPPPGEVHPGYVCADRYSYDTDVALKPAHRAPAASAKGTIHDSRQLAWFVLPGFLPSNTAPGINDDK